MAATSPSTTGQEPTACELSAYTLELSAAYDARGFEGMVGLMRAHSDDATWQIAACCQLSVTLLGEQPTDTMVSRRAGNAGAVEAVVAALRVVSASVCLKALFYLVQHADAAERNRARACAAGAVEALVAALPALQESHSLRYCALLLA